MDRNLAAKSEDTNAGTMEPSCVLVNQDWSVFNDLNVDFNETKCLKLIDIAIKDKIDKLWANDEFRTASAIFDKGNGIII